MPVLTSETDALPGIPRQMTALADSGARRRSVIDNRAVPRLCSFYGIVIDMYRPDHPPPHFHAQYGEHIAQITLGSLEILHGHLPARAL